jgi:hypothetical protein
VEKGNNMNIVKMLNKQKEAGKEIVMADGNIISKDEINKANMKAYLAGIKSGEISSDVSLTAYAESQKDDYISIDDVIGYIEGKEE